MGVFEARQHLSAFRVFRFAYLISSVIRSRGLSANFFCLDRSMTIQKCSQGIKKLQDKLFKVVRQEMKQITVNNGTLEGSGINSTHFPNETEETAEGVLATLDEQTWVNDPI